MKYRMIQRCRESCSIRMMCRCLRGSPSGYYGGATRPPSPRAQANAQLRTQNRQLHADQDGVVGSQRIWEDLRYAGERCGRHRVARLMRRAGLQGVPQRRRWRMKRTGVRPAGTQNHLNRDVTAAAPHTKWVTDIIRGATFGLSDRVHDLLLGKFRPLHRSTPFVRTAEAASLL